MNIIKFGALAFLALTLSPLTAQAASDSLTTVCNNAGGKIVNYAEAPVVFLRSLTTQNAGARIQFQSGGVYQIDLGWNTDFQNTLANSIMEDARTAYLTGAKVNLCVDTSASPNKIWAIEYNDGNY